MGMVTMRFHAKLLNQYVLSVLLFVIMVRCRSTVSTESNKANNITNCTACVNNSVQQPCEGMNMLNRTWKSNCKNCSMHHANCSEFLDCLCRNNTGINTTIVSSILPTSMKISTSKTTSEVVSNGSGNGGKEAGLFGKELYLYIVALGPPVVLIFIVILVVCCKRKCYLRKSVCVSTTVELQQSVSPTDSVIESPIYCEADVFRFNVIRETQSLEPSDTTDVVSAESIVDPLDDEEDGYCDPENIDASYEIMRPHEVNEEYSIAYGHLLAGYVNTFPREGRGEGEGDYDYPLNDKCSSEYEYRYAYDWMNGHVKTNLATLSSSEPVLAFVSPDEDNDENDVDLYINYPNLTQENACEDQSEKPLEYVKVL